MSFHVGQKVVCVDAVNDGRYTPWPIVGSIDGLTLNAIYIVRAVGLFRNNPCLWLAEINREPDKHGEPGYSILRFRPVVEDKKKVSFTIGADPESERWDNRVRIPAKT